MRNKIRALRKERKLTQEKLVIGSSITRQHVSLLENEEVEPSLRVANEIAKALDTCVYRVFDIDGTGSYNC